jgi:S1-C subfamily serine protease
MTTRSILDLPGIRELHSRKLLFPFVVLLVVAAVLVHGAFSPRVEQSAEAATEPVPVAPAFRPEFEKTPLSYTADYWLQVGEQWRPHIVLIGRDQAPAIVVAPRLAVTSADVADDWIAEELARGIAARADVVEAAGEGAASAATDEPVAESGSDDEVADESEELSEATEEKPPYRLVSVSTEHEIAVFELAAPATPAPVANLRELQSGAHAAALSLTPDESLRITPGVVVSAQVATDYPEQGSFVGETLDVAIPFPAETRVAAISDLDGGLLGVAFEGKTGLHVIPAHKVRDLARQASEMPPCISIETQDLDEQVRTILGVSEGVFVERVNEEAFFPEPSIRAGDIISRWAGEPAPTREAFEQAYLAQEPGSLARYMVFRDGRRLRGATRVPDARCRPVSLGIVPFANLGLVLRWDVKPPTDGSVSGSVPGWVVMSVVPGSSAETAGLRRDDRIVAVQGRGFKPNEPRKVLEAIEEDSRPAVLTVSRGGRLQLVAVSRAPAPASDE